MTRNKIAMLIVSHGLRTAGVALESSNEELPLDARLIDIVPRYPGTGRHRFIYGVGVAGHGLNLALSVGSEESVTVGNIVKEFAIRLPVRLYRCQDTTEIHFYDQKGSGICQIDGTTLVKVTL
jgi:hypothetical protein